MIAPKGGRWHRLAGRVFLVSMLVMAVHGGHIAALADVRISVLAVVATAYLASSGALLARRADGEVGTLEWALPAAGIGIMAHGVHLGIDAGHGLADLMKGGFAVPAAVYFVFASLAGLAALGDAWMRVRGGFGRRERILQHLWRVCAALYIAASSVFNGQQDLFPEFRRGSLALQAPSLLVIALLVFWRIRAGTSKRYRSRRANAQATTMTAAT